MVDHDEALALCDKLRFAACDPDSPLYGSSIVPWIDELTTYVRESGDRVAEERALLIAKLEFLKKEHCPNIRHGQGLDDAISMIRARGPCRPAVDVDAVWREAAFAVMVEPKLRAVRVASENEYKSILAEVVRRLDEAKGEPK